MSKDNTPPKTWTPGESEALVVVSCCPVCGSTIVYHRGRTTAPRSVVYWRCTAGHSWKSPDRALIRATRLA